MASKRRPSKRPVEGLEGLSRGSLDGAGEAILVHDLSGRFLDASAAACEVLGYSRQELLARMPADIAAPEEAEIVPRRIEEIFRRGRLVFETTHVTRDGRRIPTEVHSRVVRYEGQPAIVCVVRDITERKRAEADLQRRAEELAALERLGRRIGAGPSLEELAQAALEEMVGGVASDLGVLCLDKGEGPQLCRDYARGPAFADAEGIAERLGRSLCGLAAAERRAVYVADLQADRRSLPADCAQAGVRSLAALPLLGGQEVLGVISAASVAERDFARDAAFLEAAAGLVAAGVQNVLLREQVRRSAGQLERRLAERRRAEESLRSISSRQEAILAAVPDIIVEVDSRKVYTWANRAGLDFFGPEMIGREAADYFEGRQDTYRKVQPLFEGDQDVVYVESWQRRRDGQKRLLAWWCRVLKDEHGNVRGVLSTARDITEHKRAEEQLRARVDFERLIAELSASFISLKTEEIAEGIDHVLAEIGRFAGADRSFVFVLNDERTEARRAHEWCAPGVEPVIDRVPRLRLGEYACFTPRLLSGQALCVPRVQDLPPEAETERRIMQALSVRSLAAVPLVFAGQVVGMLGLDCVRQERSWPDDTIGLLRIVGEMIVNALHRGRAEEERKTSERRYRELYEGSRDGYAEVDLDGRIVTCNSAFRDMLGYSEQELRSKTYRDITPEVWHEMERRILDEQVFPRGYSEVYEKQYIRKDGSAIPIEIRTYLLTGPSGQPAGMWAFVRDVSARKELEAQFRQAQKMEAVGRLAGGIAHDFNNQLTVVKGYCDLLLSGAVSADASRAEIEEIRGAAERAHRLTSQLLAFSRKQVLQPEVTNLNDVLTEMHNPLSRMIGEDVRLSIVTDPDLGSVRVDRGQLQHVVMNLSVNARDAMPGGGRLTIETANVELDAEYARRRPDASPGPHVMLAVRDTGEGMDAETLARIFEPFFTTKAAGKGTGLGLSTVYGFVKQSGGSIDVASEPGRGTTFKVYLPRVPRPEQALAEPSAAEGVPGGSETILVAEDDQAVRQVIVRVLRQQGYTVLEAGGARQALSMGEVHDGRIDLLVTDVVMPSLNGPELARRLRVLRPDLRVLYVSGYTANAVVHHGPMGGPDSLLPKPFEPADLARMVRRALDQPPAGGRQGR